MSTIIPQTKHCAKCGETKSINEFYKCARDDFQSRCKSCQNEYSRNWRLTHRERHNFIALKSYHRHPEQYKKRTQQWRENNQEHIANYSRQWRIKHHEHRSTYQRKWVAYNLDKVYAAIRRREARKRSLPATLTTNEWHFCLEYWNYCCAYCGAQQSFWHTIEMDHFIPLTAKDCPGTVAMNIVPACKRCNSSKNDTPPADWLIREHGKRKAKQILARIEIYFASLDNPDLL